jgi:hypothetical protein
LNLFLSTAQRKVVRIVAIVYLCPKLTTVVGVQSFKFAQLKTNVVEFRSIIAQFNPLYYACNVHFV